MRILVAQLNCTVGDVGGNVKKIISFIQEGKRKECDLVMFPELAICGYPPEDLLIDPGFIDAVEEGLQKVVEASEGIGVVVGLVRRTQKGEGKPLYNSAAVLAEGKIVGFYDKRLLPTYDVFSERRYFAPGLASFVWPWKGRKIGITICEDLWAEEGGYEFDPVQELVQERVDLLLNLSASPYERGKVQLRQKVCHRAATSCACPVLLGCQVGGNDSLVFDGHSLYVDSQGKVVQVAKGFAEDQMVIDLEEKREEVSLPPSSIAEVYQALVLGVRDYFHKQGFTKAVLGVSGGIDSAVVACIATEALGKERVTGIYLSSRYSSLQSGADAKGLSLSLGIAYLSLSIESVFSSYLQELSSWGISLEGVVEENLQPRIRAAYLMAYANSVNALLLNTGNKSELALGYCTLYGDLAGAISVLGDVKKGWVYELASWINREKEVIPFSIVEKAPTAELAVGQKDSDTLPPYPVLDAIIEGDVEEGRGGEEIAHLLHLPASFVEEVMAKIAFAEYKRKQAPLEIRVTKKAFRAGRRYPIVQKWHKKKL